MDTFKEWELREVFSPTTSEESSTWWLWTNRVGEWEQLCYVVISVGGEAGFVSAPRLDKQLIADLSWVCYQIEGGKKRGRLR